MPSRDEEIHPVVIEPLTDSTDLAVCPQPCEHLSQEDAREGHTC